MINEEQFITLAARKLAGQATAAELQELDDLLRENVHLHERFLILQQYFSSAEAYTAADTEQALERTCAKIQKAPEEPLVVVRKKSRRWMYAAAAMAVGIAVCVTVFWPRYKAAVTLAIQPPPDTAQWLARQNGRATRAVIELADGSKVWLNADSKITYPPVFGKSERVVFLSGEAFFNVVGSADRPFIVHLSQGTVKVLGTSFNVRAYENEPVQTSVTTGKVAFIPRYTNAGQKQDTILIVPDEKVIYRHNSGNLVKEVTSGEDEKAWTEGRLVFKDVKLAEICQELERTFGKKIAFESDQLREYRLTGSFKDNSLQEIMYYLSKSKPFKYTITDSLLVIRE